MTKSSTMSKIRSIKKILKFFVYGCAVLGVGFLVYRYDLESIPSGYEHLEPQHMPSGTRVLSIDCDEDTKLGLGSVIRYAPPIGGGSMTFGVVAGLPGEVIVLGDSSRQEVAMRVGGRREEIRLPAKHKIPPGPIPDGYFLVLLGDRHLRSSAGHPDSRQLGLVKRSWIEAKIISSLYFF